MVNEPLVLGPLMFYYIQMKGNVINAAISQITRARRKRLDNKILDNRIHDNKRLDNKMLDNKRLDNKRYIDLLIAFTV